MNKQQAAMKLALEALESCTPGDYSTGHVIHPSYDENAVESSIAALRQAIEQAEQAQPVAWATRLGEYAHIQWGSKRPEYPMVYEVPLYTAPPPRQPLTDEQADECIEAALGNSYWASRSALEQDLLRKAGRAIERAHGIKGEA